MNAAVVVVIKLFSSWCWVKKSLDSRLGVGVHGQWRTPESRQGQTGPRQNFTVFLTDFHVFFKIR